MEWWQVLSFEFVTQPLVKNGTEKLKIQIGISKKVLILIVGSFDIEMEWWQVLSFELVAQPLVENDTEKLKIQKDFK